MKRLGLAGQFLRRNDTRTPVRCAGLLECRGVSRRIDIVDFSTSGLRADQVTGLVAGDRVTVTLTPELTIEGTIVWLVWHKAGIQFARALSDTDPIHSHLAAEAAKLRLARTRALTALAQRDVIRTNAGISRDPLEPSV